MRIAIYDALSITPPEPRPDAEGTVPPQEAQAHSLHSFQAILTPSRCATFCRLRLVASHTDIVSESEARVWPHATTHQW